MSKSSAKPRPGPKGRNKTGSGGREVGARRVTARAAPGLVLSTPRPPSRPPPVRDSNPLDQYLRDLEAAESALAAAQRKHKADIAAATERLMARKVVVTVKKGAPVARAGSMRLYWGPKGEEAETPEPLPNGWSRQSALMRGEAQLVAWVEDGTLRPLAALAASWGVTRAALDQAGGRGDLFSLKVAGRRVVPSVFFGLHRTAIAAVSRELQGLDAAEQLIFWLRAHGGLSGRTIAQTLEAGDLTRAVSVAAGWAEERGLRQGEAVAHA
jgi:hypothetical protein